ncbi:MAG: alcohol dehydrogenase catalytic domain-containing protein [Thermoleophilia bacterium]|nr:alcohol dehydrogenase catalytic domain-containing protein [Thermoleophilia bacterium]
MRVAVYYSNTDLRIEERPVPGIGPDELLVRVEASGICGSDVMEWYRIHKVPLVLGHEIAGEIVEVGESVTAYSMGDRVAVTHHVPCMACHYCASGHHTVCETLRTTSFDPGGFAEYVRVPAINVELGTFLLPDNVSYEEGSFVEPVACVLRGQQQAGLKPGASMLVIGAGISGLLHVMTARALGAGRIVATDVIDYRLKMARQLGAEETIKASEDVPARFRELNGGRGADIVVLCAGAAPAIEQALKSVSRAGTVLFFATTRPEVTYPLPVNEFFWRNEATLTSSYAGSPSDCRAALELIRAGRLPVGQTITHRLSLSEIESGFDLVINPRDSVKVIIEPQR